MAEDGNGIKLLSKVSSVETADELEPEEALAKARETVQVGAAFLDEEANGNPACFALVDPQFLDLIDGELVESTSAALDVGRAMIVKDIARRHDGKNSSWGERPA